MIFATNSPTTAADDLDDDAGITLVELVLSLFVTALLLPVIFTLITGLFNAGAGEANTLTALQQDQQASAELIQYLHGTALVLAGSGCNSVTGVQTLIAEIDAGTSSTGAPESAVMTATYTPGTSSRSGTFTTTIAPSVATQTATMRTSSIDALAPGSGQCTSAAAGAIFTYELSSGAATTVPTLSQLGQTIAVDVDVSFLGQSAAAAQQSESSTLETTVYLDNSTDAAGVGDSTTATASTSGIPAGQIAVNATVVGTGSPSINPSSGVVSITFSYVSGGTTEYSSPGSCQSLLISSSSNAVSCTASLQPLVTYGVIAEYAGTPGSTGYTASESPALSVTTT